MKDYYLRIGFSKSGTVIVRTVKVRAPTILDAAHDAEHICNGYRLGTGLDAELLSVSTRLKSQEYLETRTDFLSAHNDNTGTQS